MEERIYLDAAGAAVPDKEFMRRICEEMINSTFGNPHSAGNAGSDAAVSRTTEARNLVRNHFKVSEDEYDVVFTSGATASINLVGQSFPWSENSRVCYPMNAHTSLLGVRDYAPNAYCVPSTSLQTVKTLDNDTAAVLPSADEAVDEHNLLLVPGECNFSGAKANLKYVAELSQLHGDYLLRASHAKMVKQNAHPKNDESSNRSPWLWLLDAAKLVATSEVDLSLLPREHRPHFVALSFYKIFGYPTGLGALLVRRDVAPLLQKKYFGGGTLQAAAADSLFSKPRQAHPHEWMEDGTPNFYAIAALRHGFAYFSQLGGMRSIEQRTFELTHDLVTAMAQLRHKGHRQGGAEEVSEGVPQGLPLCTIYGRHFEEGVSSKTQGAVISFSLRWADGTPIGFSEVGRLAAERNIQLRTGCFCNVGGCQEAFQQSAADVEYNYSIGRVCSEAGHDVVNGKHTGAVRVSLGHHSTSADCAAFLHFLKEVFLDRAPEAVPVFEPPSVDGLSSTALMPLDMNELFLTPAPGETQQTENGALAQQGDASVPRPIKLAAIFVYPIKSCAGMRVESWPVCSTGLLYDRAWAVVDAQGRAITQKVHAKLALVQPSINLQDGVMLVRAPGMAEVLAISLSDSGAVTPCSDSGSSAVKADTVSVCGQVRQGRRISFDADRWFAQYLSNPNPSTNTDSQSTARATAPRKEVVCSLLRCAETPSDGDKKEINGASKAKEGGGDISFANTAQFLLLSLESVHALTQMILASNDAARGSLNIKVENFRPNLLVSGGIGAPHQEDAWKSITISGPSCQSDATSSAGDHRAATSQERHSNLQLQITGPCGRCSMVNVDGTSGSMDCRAFQALATYRKDGSSVYFGQFCSLTQFNDDKVWLSVGSNVNVM